MHGTFAVKAVVAGAGLALALSAGACANDNRATDELDRNVPEANTADRTAGGTAADARGHEGAPITMTGCLQKGDGINNYIITGVNRPSESVGTSGSSSGNTVERQQIRAASHAFRLDGDNDKLEPLVGNQVRVAGTYEEGSDLWRERTEGTGGQARTDDARGSDRDRDRRDRIDIDQDDLAKIDVNSVEKIADVCGQAAK